MFMVMQNIHDNSNDMILFIPHVVEASKNIN